LDEVGRFAGHHDVDLRSEFDELGGDVGGFVCGDGAGDAEQDILSVEKWHDGRIEHGGGEQGKEEVRAKK
jgi:hypothetical protein